MASLCRDAAHWDCQDGKTRAYQATEGCCFRLQVALDADDGACWLCIRICHLSQQGCLPSSRALNASWVLQIKEARSGLTTQQTLRVRAAKSWLQQRWRLCLLGAFLLLLFMSALVRFSAYDPYRASQLQQEDILASVRCAPHKAFRQQYMKYTS